MNKRSPKHGVEASLPVVADLSAGVFPQSSQVLLACLDRQLGYFGAARYVCFRYEIRGEEVLWSDDRSEGFGAGGWQIFLNEVAPIAERCRVDVGTKGRNPTHVLLIDREEGRACFAERKSAERLVATQGRPADHRAAEQTPWRRTG